MKGINAIAGKEITPAEFSDYLSHLVAYEKAGKELEENFYFKLFQLELEIRKRGDFIATHIDRSDRRKIYELIQSILQDIGFFGNHINGEQTTTMTAVINFQNRYNEFADETTQLKKLGNVGYGTLEAFRSWYRMKSPIEAQHEKKPTSTERTHTLMERDS